MGVAPVGPKAPLSRHETTPAPRGFIRGRVETMKIGTKVRTLYQFSETGVIVKPRKGEMPPTPEWHIVKFDDGGDKLCVHHAMLAVSNQ